MRIAELSERSGVPVPTIKYYLREGLLPPGESIRANQARYDERHLQRLRLVRVLIDVGRLPVAAIRDLFADLDRPDPDLHHALGRALKSAPAGGPEPPATGDVATAELEVDDLLRRRGWLVSEEAPARRRVAEVIAALRRLDNAKQVEMIDEYAAAVERIAELDLQLVQAADPETVVYRAVVGTILGDALLAGLRRLAQESVSDRLFHDRTDSSD
ncbi:MerR family transcriptional regulator [Virgisporangium aurantiacum]|uniref:Transcriptional regulator n=1 Tax=Virgisporangium aurantiacum TaxID=175570 RepID=A0A8J3ZAV4_9ACTN|nr:MerR family transcriptional regulator [Virgisporangium aurantiacum]GIJ57923.1 transcriptional regulator [Virgisporangium aurantiacum]